SARFEQIKKAYQAARDGDARSQARELEEAIARMIKDADRNPALQGLFGTEEDVRRIIKELDKEGRWITTVAGEPLVGQPKFERGFRYLSSDVFSRNIETLSEYLASPCK